MKFKDLKFEKWRKAPSYYEPLQRVVLGKRAKVDFPNGYTVSIILGHEDVITDENGFAIYPPVETRVLAWMEIPEYKHNE